VATSAYSCGGGGANFEQKFAATQMAALLAGLPSRVLGSDVQLETIEFQGEDHAVDDLQLTGESPAGGRRTAVIAVRHDPVIGKSDEKLVKLVATMALTLARHRDDCRSGTLRLGLVVGDPHTAARELEELTELARAIGDRDAAVLKKKVAASKAKLRTRYALVAEVLAAALTKPDPELASAAGADDTTEREQFPESLPSEQRCSTPTSKRGDKRVTSTAEQETRKAHRSRKY